MPRSRRAAAKAAEEIDEESDSAAENKTENGDVSPGSNATEEDAEADEEAVEVMKDAEADEEVEVMVKEEVKKVGKIPKKIKKRKQEEDDESAGADVKEEASSKKKTRAEAKALSAEDLEMEKAQIVDRIVIQQTQAELVEFIKKCAMSNESVYEELIQVAQNNPLQRKLYIRGGVSKSSEDEVLKAYFDEHYGVVEDCIIIKGDKNAKGAYAFVVMKDVADFDKALKDDGVVSFEGGGVPLIMQYSAIKGSIGKPDPKEKDGGRDLMKDGRSRDRDRGRDGDRERDRGRGRSGRRDRSNSRDRDDRSRSRRDRSHSRDRENSRDRDIREVEKSRLEQRKIFVRNLPDAASNRDLEDTFSKYGSLDECEVIMNKNSTVSKGYGFVTFSRASEASRALESPRKIVCGKETISQYASTNRKGSETTSSDMRSSDARSSKYDDVGSYGPQLTDTYSSSSYSSSSYGGGRKDTSSSIQELPSQPALETYQYKAAVNNQPQYTQPTSATQYGSSTTQYGVQPSPLYNTSLQQQQQPYQYSAVAQQGHPGSTVQYPQQQQQSTVYDPTNPAQNTLYQMPGAVPQQQYYSQQQPQTAMPQQQTQQFDQQHLQPQYTYQQPTNQPVYRQNPNYHN